MGMFETGHAPDMGVLLKFPAPFREGSPAVPNATGKRFPPTREQAALLKAYKESRDDLIGDAGAGSGKTSTLIMLAEENPSERFLYLCFNRRIAEEAARKFPRNVTVRTAHSLAYRELKLFKYKQKLAPGRYDFAALFQRIFEKVPKTVLIPGVSGRQYIDLLREIVKAFELSVDKEIAIPADGKLARLITAVFIHQTLGPGTMRDDQKDVVELFDNGNGGFRAGYANFVEMLETIGRDKRRSSLLLVRSADPLAVSAFIRFYRSSMIKERVSEFLQQMERHAREFFRILVDLNSDVPFEHSTYLKVYQLREPVLHGFDTIIFDEVQDANAVILDIVERQKTRKVWVGDRHQEIYAFTGAVNAIPLLLERGVRSFPLTKSFRFGPEIAEIANRVLSLKCKYFPAKYDESSILTIEGAGSGDETGPVAILCRSNVGVLEEVLDLIDEDIYFGDCLPRKYLLSMIDIHDLKTKRTITRADSPYHGYETLEELKVESELRGDIDTKRAIDIMEEMGASRFRQAVALLLQMSGTTQESAQCHILTAHKAKGLEWRKVRLSDDFLPSFLDKRGRLRQRISEEEINLLYVAVTRARHVLVLPRELSSLLDPFSAGCNM